jgi:hypothetical protein
MGRNRGVVRLDFRMGNWELRTGILLYRFALQIGILLYGSGLSLDLVDGGDTGYDSAYTHFAIF